MIRGNINFRDLGTKVGKTQTEGDWANLFEQIVNSDPMANKLSYALAINSSIVEKAVSSYLYTGINMRYFVEQIVTTYLTKDQSGEMLTLLLSYAMANFSSAKGNKVRSAALSDPKFKAAMSAYGLNEYKLVNNDEKGMGTYAASKLTFGRMSAVSFIQCFDIFENSATLQNKISKMIVEAGIFKTTGDIPRKALPFFHPNLAPNYLEYSQIALFYGYIFGLRRNGWENQQMADKQLNKLYVVVDTVRDGKPFDSSSFASGFGLSSNKVLPTKQFALTILKPSVPKGSTIDGLEPVYDDVKNKAAKMATDTKTFYDTIRKIEKDEAAAKKP